MAFQGEEKLYLTLLAGIPKVDQYILNPNIDQTVSLCDAKKIDFDTAVYLLRTNHNLLFYDNAMFRHTNFRRVI